MPPLALLLEISFDRRTFQNRVTMNADWLIYVIAESVGRVQHVSRRYLRSATSVLTKITKIYSCYRVLDHIPFCILLYLICEAWTDCVNKSSVHLCLDGKMMHINRDKIPSPFNFQNSPLSEIFIQTIILDCYKQ